MEGTGASAWTERFGKPGGRFEEPDLGAHYPIFRPPKQRIISRAGTEDFSCPFRGTWYFAPVRLSKPPLTGNRCRELMRLAPNGFPHVWPQDCSSILRFSMKWGMMTSAPATAQRAQQPFEVPPPPAQKKGKPPPPPARELSAIRRAFCSHAPSGRFNRPSVERHGRHGSVASSGVCDRTSNLGARSRARRVPRRSHNQHPGWSPRVPQTGRTNSGYCCAKNHAGVAATANRVSKIGVKSCIRMKILSPGKWTPARARPDSGLSPSPASPYADSSSSRPRPPATRWRRR